MRVLILSCNTGGGHNSCARAILEEFIRCGVPAEKIFATGIPVDEVFFTCQEKERAKAGFSLPPDCKHLLVMFGSMGCGPMKKLIKCIVRQMPQDGYVSVICGTNRCLRGALERTYRREPRVRAYGFTKDVAGLMDSADLYLTKPGGLSTTEAAAKGLPMLLIDAVAGCESHNLEFFAKAGGAATAMSAESLAACAVETLRDREMLSRMARALRQSVCASPSYRICQLIIQGEREDAG